VGTAPFKGGYYELDWQFRFHLCILYHADCGDALMKEKSKHSDTVAVIRAGKKKAKKRTTKRQRQLEKRADYFLQLENSGLSDSWME
jgi:hypothetical protein